MRILRRIALITIVIIVQLLLVMQFTCPSVNLAKISYRRSERAAAMEAFAQNRTPENEAVFKQELRLASWHVGIQQSVFTGVVLAAILSFEGLIIYLGRKHEHDSIAVA